METIKDTEFFNRTITRLAMKSRELLPEEIVLIKEAYNNNAKDVIYQYALNNKVLPFVSKLFYGLNLDKLFWGDIYSSFEERMLFTNML